MRQRSGGQLVVEALAAHGVDRVFCVPGESYLDVLDALYDSDIQTIVCRHEGGAAYMAEAQGKLTGRPGVVMVTRGPGAANAVVGIHTAYQDAVPMILFVGLVPVGHRDREAFQEFDLSGWFGTTTKAVFTLESADRAQEIVTAAFHAARSGRPGPVVVGLPEDVLVEIAPSQPMRPRPVGPGFVPAVELSELAHLIGAARRPLVVVGGSGWTAEASKRFTAWAEAWQLPVAADFRAHDALDHDSPSYVGFLGYGRDDRLAARLDQADLVVAVGCTLGDVGTDGFTLRARPDAVQVVISPDTALRGHFGPVTRHIVSGPVAFAAAVDSLPAPDAVRWSAWAVEARRQLLERRRIPAARSAAGVPPAEMNAVMAALNERIPADTIVTYGAGNHAIWPQRFIQHHGPGSLLSPRNGSMGYGVPAAISASLSHPGRAVVSVAGDGCFMMNGQELSTAVQYGATPLVIVMDNGQYGTIRAHQEHHYPGRVSGTQLSNPDFAALARSHGAHGETVATNADAGPALDRALEAIRLQRIPALVHVVVDPAALSPDC